MVPATKAYLLISGAVFAYLALDTLKEEKGLKYKLYQDRY